MNKPLATAMLLISVSAIAACSKEAPEELPPPPVDTSVPAPTPPPSNTSNVAGPGTQAHFRNAVGQSTVVFFDTDRFNIDSSDAAALQAQAQYFAQYPSLTFTIEGHCDERGTREYNLALGERRANSAKNYLVSLGISPDRITTVSFGKERPVALASTQEAWAENRRAASVLIN